MAIDASVIGSRSPRLTVEAGRGRLRLFAHAIGESDPVYTDVAAARAAGHRDLPVPPTFLFCLEMERPDPFDYVRTLGVDLNRLLHAEQGFTYHAMAYAGDLLAFDSRLTDVYSKRNGALDFLVRTTDVTRHGAPIAELTTVLAVRNPEAAP